MLNVGVNLLFLRSGQVGTEIYVREVVSRLPSHGAALTLFCTSTTAESLENSITADVVPMTRGEYSISRRLLAENWTLRRHLEQHGVDVLFNPGNYAVPLIKSVPQVVTIHDLQHVVAPQNFTSRKRLQRSLLYRASLPRAAHVIAISDATRKDIETRFGLSPKQITTIHLGWNPNVAPSEQSVESTLARHRLKRPFFYYAADDLSHKNHSTLIEAYSRLFDHQPPPFDIVLTGKRAPDDRIGRLITAEMSEYVRDLGFVERSEVFDLISAATVVVFPSTFEGFGLPLLEAMQCGTPVIASGTTAIPEVVGDAGLLLDPNSPDSWSEAMIEVFGNRALREELTARGFENLKLFDWDQCARQTYEVLRRAAAS